MLAAHAPQQHTLGQVTKPSNAPEYFKGTLDGRYYIIESIGEEGGNGKAFIAWDVNTSSRVAIKRMKTNSEASKAMVKKEGDKMSLVDHPNVLKVISYGEGKFKSPSGKEQTWIYLVLELAQEDTLFDYIVETNPFPETLAVHFFEQFIRGLQAIHLQGISHRDIKCENVFIDHEYNLKIADFGFANTLSGLKTQLGTKGQIAPEIEYLQEGQKYQGAPVDVFNAGIILFCMVFQRMPFGRAVNQDKNYKYVVLDSASHYWQLHKMQGLNVDNVSSSCKELIWSMLQRQPELRPSLNEILASEWMTNTKKMNKDLIVTEFEKRRANMDARRQ